MSGLYLVVSAPSGAGKTTILREFHKIFPEVRFSVSHTTRPPRPGEVNGVDYHFVSEEEFRNLIAQDAFIEWEENFGHLYGTSRKLVEGCLQEGKDVLLDIEPRGARRVKKGYPGGAFVLILPPTLEDLQLRLTKRGEEDGEIRLRLKYAVEQIRQAAWYDYVIVNDVLSRAVENLSAIYRAERCKKGRFVDQIAEFTKGVGRKADLGYKR